ncbi:hypothetical protein [Natronoglycomyces albus]|uniref:Uncharacterized protein n=1 Tax=Natronoglycomyces albus TaxID=2811108 RepID=A0A895XQG4_9ACTN|nr:hypothetical protein [Natronoglycomyces albus]QSB04796.1 hypothetical protein JQS30_13640 [Natronoglycomyces albus]
MRWRVNSKRTLYQDQWVHGRTADIELPDGRHLDRRLIDAGDITSGTTMTALLYCCVPD